jgi:hypothetical protein
VLPLAHTFTPLLSTKSRQGHSAPHQIFKEQIDIGGAAKQVSSYALFYRFLPIKVFSSEARPLKDDKDGKDDRNLKFNRSEKLNSRNLGPASPRRLCWN